MTIAAVIVAAGSGSRARTDAASQTAKQYRSLAGRPVLRRTVEAFFASKAVEQIQVVIGVDAQADYAAAMGDLAHAVLPPVVGGADRQASVLAGLEGLASLALSQTAPVPTGVMIHDAARALISPAAITRMAGALSAAMAPGSDGTQGATDGLLMAVPATDTLKRVDADHRCLETLDRTTIWQAQTPQAFPFAAILGAHRNALRESADRFTDDTAVHEWAGHTVRVIEGERTNFKFTTPDDFLLAEALLRAREAGGATTEAPAPSTTPGAPQPHTLRIGSGYDVHALGPGDHVMLGGVRIAHTQTLLGHSDADVVLHALVDAMLGALGAGDIGSHFPPSDPQWKGAASHIFVEAARDLVTARGGSVVNVDLTVICERPKIGPHRLAMRERIAELIDAPLDAVSVKATTSEKLGFTGRGEGIAAQASVLISLQSR